MDRKDFDRLLSQGKIPSVLLFEGEEEHMKQSALDALQKKLLPEGLEELNRTLLDAPETDQIIAAAETLPFMADRRLVIVRNHPALIGRAEADDRLAEYLPSVPPSAVLLFFCTQKPDGRKKLYTVIKKLNGVVVFSPLRDRELTTFVTSAFRDLGKECDERTADFLIFTSGSDTGLLLTEIAKVAAHAGESPVIHPDSVRAVATPSTECTVFQMVDAVVSGQSSRAFLLMRNQLLAGADRMYMLSMLLRQFRLLQHIKGNPFRPGRPALRRGSVCPPGRRLVQRPDQKRRQYLLRYRVRHQVRPPQPGRSPRSRHAETPQPPPNPKVTIGGRFF